MVLKMKNPLGSNNPEIPLKNLFSLTTSIYLTINSITLSYKIIIIFSFKYSRHIEQLVDYLGETTMDQSNEK